MNSVLSWKNVANEKKFFTISEVFYLKKSEKLVHHSFHQWFKGYTIIKCYLMCIIRDLALMTIDFFFLKESSIFLINLNLSSSQFSLDIFIGLQFHYWYRKSKWTGSQFESKSFLSHISINNSVCFNIKSRDI